MNINNCQVNRKFMNPIHVGTLSYAWDKFNNLSGQGGLYINMS
ncbi:MAG: hypothetical protein Q7S53_01710 [bacterium]|nr:hypothetical protein [bacterium]